MTKLVHLQFLALMIPTIVVLCAAAWSMADLALPGDHAPATPPVATAVVVVPAAVEAWDDRPAP
jgi:hypothetical protein